MFFLTLFLTLVFVNCQSQFQEALPGSYWEILEKNSKQIHVVEKFQKKIDLHATYLSQELTDLISQKWRNLYGDQNLPDLPNGNTVFLVSVFSNDTPFDKFEDQSLWRIHGEDKQGTFYNPKSILPIYNKHLWTPFFPYINHWSKEYLITFPTMPVNGVKTLYFQSIFLETQLSW